MGDKLLIDILRTTLGREPTPEDVRANASPGLREAIRRLHALRAAVKEARNFAGDNLPAVAGSRMVHMLEKALK